MKKAVVGLACALALVAVTAAAAPRVSMPETPEDDRFLRGPDERHWKPIPDDVYLQEVSRHLETDAPVTAVAVLEDTLYAVMDGALYTEADNELSQADGAPSGVNRLRALNGELWALTGEGLYRYGGDAWTQVDDQEFVDVTMHLGAVHAATRMEVFRLEDDSLVSIEPEGGYEDPGITFRLDDGSLHLPQPIHFGPLDRIASYGETVYGLRPGSLVLFDGVNIDGNTQDWGLLPSRNTRDMLAFNGRLYVATDRGVGELRGMSMFHIDGEAGLPYEDTTCLAIGFDKDLWIGTTMGAVRRVNDNEFHYFAADRWLPNNNVRDIAVGDNIVYVATDGGLGIIEYEPYTLAKKAAYYEQRLEELGHKRLGFTHLIVDSDEHGGWVREVTDNDGGYTAHYMVAMAYKYAVTGDEQAREEAVNTFEALAWLEEITPMPGFPARSISVVGEPAIKSMHASGGWPATWHLTEDGLFEWKGDTSSDETGAHLYGVAIFHDIAARGEEKERAAEHLRRMVGHIIDNGWLLRDYDGTPTRWGRWDPSYLFTPYGQYAQGLNGLEAQAKAATAWALAGDERFGEGYQQLIDWGYHTYSVRAKHAFPPNYIVPWDDRLAFMSYHPLLKYVDEPALRNIYMRSLKRSWEVKRMEKYAWYNMLYAIMTGNDYEADVSMKHLREWPLDLVNHRFQNSHRHDLHVEDGYRRYAEGDRAMSPKGLSFREIAPRKIDGNTLSLDGGNGRMSITPNAWLETYWMARYYGLIEEPTVTDEELLTVQPTEDPQGAAPYDGPPRPTGIIPGR